MKINTVNGPIDSATLGRTLMHEHLVVGLPGWESDTATPAPEYRNLVATCVDRVQELKDAAFSSMLDPCPNDLGRDVNLMADVSARTGLNIIFATGLYNEHMGGSPYWKLVSRLDADADKRLCEMFVREIEDGVGGTGIRPGVIKVGTAEPPFSNYERMVFRAAAMASTATNTPITTHTEGVLGDEQVAYLVAHGVEASRIIVGHCCGSADHVYHSKIAEMGAFLGFDRFGVPYPHSDEERVESILKLKKAGAFEKIIVSHDSICHWRGSPFPPAISEMMDATHYPMRFTRVIAPMLNSAGVTDDEIETLLVDNPRRYFEAGT